MRPRGLQALTEIYSLEGVRIGGGSCRARGRLRTLSRRRAAGMGLWGSVRLCAGRLHCGRYRYPLEALEAFCGLVARHSAGAKKAPAVQTDHRGIKRPPTRGGRGL